MRHYLVDIFVHALQRLHEVATGHVRQLCVLLTFLMRFSIAVIC